MDGGRLIPSVSAYFPVVNIFTFGSSQMVAARMKNILLGWNKTISNKVNSENSNTNAARMMDFMTCDSRLIMRKATSNGHATHVDKPLFVYVSGGQIFR